MLKRHPSLDALVAVLSAVTGGLLVYFSSIRLYASLQTGEILFRPRLGPASVGPQAAIWYMGHLVLGMLCVADGASVLRRMSARVSTPDPRDQSL
ncbi:hypothetical protein [Xanthomonas arboricola]|uniref:hypothetical protein n=1 Tax=Xanthomonas arboricola TaxID=56448 RepID=UPI000E1F7DC6|nr:hypothetical protein [Xanthomonas arboricola]